MSIHIQKCDVHETHSLFRIVMEMIVSISLKMRELANASVKFNVPLSKFLFSLNVIVVLPRFLIRKIPSFFVYLLLFVHLAFI